MGVTFYCPRCWAENRGDDKLCRQCGAMLVEDTDFISKLITALHHPEPQTPLRAAQILGELREHRAVEPLSWLLLHAEDGYQRAAAAQALGEIGDERAIEPLASAIGEAPLVARVAAAQALGRFPALEARIALRQALRDPNDAVRMAASAAMRKLST